MKGAADERPINVIDRLFRCVRFVNARSFRAIRDFDADFAKSKLSQESQFRGEPTRSASWRLFARESVGSRRAVKLRRRGEEEPPDLIVGAAESELAALRKRTRIEGWVLP